MSDLHFNESSNLSVPSTNSTVQKPATSVALTTQELWFQLIFSYGIIGFISAILNLLIAIVVVRVEHLHNRFFVFIFFLSVARFLYAVNHVMLCIWRSLRTAGIVATARSSLTCHTLQIFTFIAPTLDLLILLLLVIDRIVSFLFPLAYRNLTNKQAMKICLLAYLACFLFRFLPSYTDVYWDKIVQCISSSFTVTPAYSSYGKYLDFGLSIAILIAYFVLFWAVRYRFRPNASGGNNVNEASLKKAMKIIPFLRLQLLMHVGLIVTSRSMQVAGDALGPEASASQRLQAYYGQICSLDVLANAVVFYSRHPKLWWASVKLVCGARLTEMFQGKKHGHGGASATGSHLVKHSAAPSVVSPVQVAPRAMAEVAVQ